MTSSSSGSTHAPVAGSSSRPASRRPSPLRLPPTSSRPPPSSAAPSPSASSPRTPNPLLPNFVDLISTLTPPFADVLSPNSSPSRVHPVLARTQSEPSSPRRRTTTGLSSGMRQELKRTTTDPEKAKKPKGPKAPPGAIPEDPRARFHPSGTGDLVLENYTLYETKTKFYITASNQADSRYRVLKIDRNAPPERSARAGTAWIDGEDDGERLSVTEDATVYSKVEFSDLLETLNAGNVGGIVRIEPLFYGIAGFVRFTSSWYMVLIKARSPVALIGGHYIYHCEETILRPVTPVPSAKYGEEQKLKAAFMGVDMSKNFYFSYTYDITHTLQHNLTTPADLSLSDPASSETSPTTPSNFASFNDKWIWNRHLLAPGFGTVKSKSGWILPLIHGFVDQAKLSVFGRTVYITLIARRSRHFAGARFLKRGVNSEGYVANDVETEQIVSEALTTAFHYPGGTAEGKKPNPRYTSFVQVRGSIPLFWSQESVNMSPKPPIELAVVDPFFSAAALHFDELFGRYGGPITVLNLIKHKESQPRESKLLPEFKQCIDYLNQFLPDDKKIKYIAWDISGHNKLKRHGTDVIGILEDIAEESIEGTGFFHTGPEPSWYALHGDQTFPTYRSTPMLQSGVVRTNCIDCLDRTNAAQFVIAKTALAHQLLALGIVHNPRLPFDSDVVDLVTEMYHDHGDTVALQYGGSHLVNTMATYRTNRAWTSHSRDMIENVRRYYTNSFIDADKQVAIDLFLGIDPLRDVKAFTRRSYRKWFTKTHLDRMYDPIKAAELLTQTGSADGNYWQSYYRPKLFTQLDRHFAYKMNSTLKYNALVTFADVGENSPFIPRKKENPTAPMAPKPKAGVAGGVRRWMSHRSVRDRAQMAETQRARTQSHKVEEAPPPLALAAPSTTEGLISRLLNPTVSVDELAEYESYIDQFSHLSLSQDLSEKDAALYERSAGLANGQAGNLSVDRGSMAIFLDAVRTARPGQDLKGAESYGGAGHPAVGYEEHRA